MGDFVNTFYAYFYEICQITEVGEQKNNSRCRFASARRRGAGSLVLVVTAGTRNYFYMLSNEIVMFSPFTFAISSWA